MRLDKGYEVFEFRVTSNFALWVLGLVEEGDATTVSFSLRALKIYNIQVVPVVLLILFLIFLDFCQISPIDNVS